MAEKMDHIIPKYFGAANSYDGFISYFDKIFDSKEYDKIYVLKGGPGTGKSSFMKRISAHFHNKNCYVEEIYCSSDPHSLDGVVVSRENKKIAIIDGTAPHERDAKIPGAIDELINLGNGWDERILTARKSEILSLTGEKTKSYKTAYHYLSVAGQLMKLIENFELEGFDIIKVKYKAESIFDGISPSVVGKTTTRLISSFGRYGEYLLSTLPQTSDKIITIGGKASAAYKFLELCRDYLATKNANYIHFPSALDPRQTEALYLIDSKIAVIRGEDCDVNADIYLSSSPADNERVRAASRIYGEMLEEARRWFSIASDIHFRLEEIYGSAMNFDNNNAMLDEKIRQIENILEIV
jgi:hypothetical protein